jgi:hypothetical protein
MNPLWFVFFEDGIRGVQPLFSSQSGLGYFSQTGPLTLAVLGKGQEIRHSMPHFGHAALSAPLLGQNRAKQAKHLTSPSLLPVMTLSIFMIGPPLRYGFHGNSFEI